MAYEPIRMRRFCMERTVDVSGTSGDGRVVEGVQFTDGKVVLKWRTPVSSIEIWDNIESAALIHGHDGDTVVRWIDPPWPEMGYTSPMNEKTGNDQVNAAKGQLR